MYFGILLLAVLAASVGVAVPRAPHRRRDALARAGRRAPSGATRPSSVAGRRAHRAADAAGHLAATTLPKGLRGQGARAPSPRSARGCAARERVVELDVHDHAACGAASTRIGPLTVRSTDPFGLARRRTRLRRAHAGRRSPRRSSTCRRSPTSPATPAARCTPRRTSSARAPTTSSRARTSPATRCAASTGARPRTATSSWCGRRSRSPRPRRSSCSTAACCGGRPRRCRRPAPTPGSRPRSSACVSAVARLVHDGYAVEVHRLRRHAARRAHRRRRHGRGRGRARRTSRRSPRAATITSPGCTRLFAGRHDRARHPHRRAFRPGGRRGDRAGRPPQHACRCCSPCRPSATRSTARPTAAGASAAIDPDARPRGARGRPRSSEE